MGLGTGPEGTLWMSSLYQLWRFENFLEPGATRDGHDAVYVPVTGHTTGDVGIHDIGTDAAGQPIFVVTRFNYLATLSERASFEPIWRPPFIDRLAAEDRCHLNGLAIKDGRPAFVTCVARTNVAEGWREHRRSGGLLIDVASGEIVASGLSMRTRRGSTGAGSGWSSPAPASSATSTSRPVASSRSASCRATPAASPSSATARSLAYPVRAKIAPSTVSRSASGWSVRALARSATSP
jgi:hypothetical protein